MCTPMDESMPFFDLELLLGSAPISETENASIHEDEYINQNLNSLERTGQVFVQNERNAEDTAVHIKTLRCLEEKNKDYDLMRRCLEEKNKDYDQLKQQYMKLGQDYADLHYESKKHALDAIKANTSFEKISEELKISQHKMIALENQCSVTNTLHKAALSNNNQLMKLVEKLETEAANFKNTTESHKAALKEEKRMNSTLKYKIKTYEEDICSIACKLDRATDKKNRDRETQRQISKYTNKKFNADLENTDSESVDTGRGSSFSNYSPAYSINFSPLNITENFEQKIMKDASTSTLQTNETIHISKLSITSPSFEVGTKSLEKQSVHVDSSKENIMTVDTASSPISFVDDMEENITTVDTASSPISFVDNRSQDMAKFTDIASSFSGIRSPGARAKMKFLDCSPKSVDIAITPIYVANPRSPTPMSPSWERTASPIELTSLKSADVTIPSNEITDISRPLEPTAVPFKPAPVTGSVIQTPDMTRSPTPMSPSWERTASPIELASLKSADVTIPSNEITDISRPLEPTAVPFKPAPVTSAVIQTPDMTRSPTPMSPSWERTASPIELASLKSADVTIPSNEITDISRPLEPTAVPFKPAPVTSSVIQTTDMTRSPTPMSPSWERTASSIELTSLKSADVTIPSIEITDISRPLEPTAVPFKPAPVTSSFVQTPDMTRPQKANAVTNPVVQTPDMTRPLQSVDVVERSIDKTPGMRRSLDPTVAPRPFKTPDMPMKLKPTAVTKHADLLTTTNDTNDVKRQSVTTKIPEMARPIETTDFFEQEAKTTRSEHVISLVDNSESVITKTTDLNQLASVRRSVIQTPSRPMKHAVARRPLITTKPLDVTKKQENIKIVSSEKSKSLKEIQSHIAQDNNQERDDLEVGMILNKFRLDWNALSPMSVTPDLDEETERQSLEHSRPQISNESDSLLEIAPGYKKITIPQNKSNNRKHKINEDNPSHLKINKVLKPDSIPSTIHAPVHEENERQSDQTMRLRKRKAPVKINDKNTNTYDEIEMPQSRSELASNINSLKSQSDVRNIRYFESNSLSHTSRNQLTDTQEYIKKEYLKEKDSIVSQPPKRRRSERIKSTSPQFTSNGVLQTQSKLQSSPIANMSTSKELQSNTRNTPEIRRSERIKSSLFAAHSKTNSVPQNQTKVHSSPLDNMSISNEPQSNTLSPPESRRLDRVKSTVPAVQSKSNSVPQTQTKLQSNQIDNMSVSKETQSNTRKPPQRRRSERINSTICPVQCKSNSVPQTQMNLQSNQIDNMSVSKETQSNTRKPPERRRSERLNSTIIPAQCKSNSVPQNQMKLQSNQIDNMSVSKETQSNTRKPPERRRSERLNSTIIPAQCKSNSVPQNQSKLQSSPIDNISTSKESQSNMCQSPERRRSERIISTTPPAKSKINSAPQNQMMLQSSQIDNMSILKETQSNMRNGCPPTISNPEYGRKRTICRTMEATTHSKQQKVSECDTNKLNTAEICSEDVTYSYSKPPKQRISRVKASVSSNPESVPNYNQSDNTNDKKATKTINNNLNCTVASNKGKLTYDTKTDAINKDLSYTQASKRAKLAYATATETITMKIKLADDTTGFLIKPGQSMSESDYIKMSISQASTRTTNNNPEAHLKSATTTVTTWTTYENNHRMALSETEQFQNKHGRYCADYNDMNIFNTDNMFNNDNNNLKTHTNRMNEKVKYEWTHNLLDKMIFKYGSKRKYVDKTKRIIINKEKYEDQIAKEIETVVSNCVNVSAYPNRYYETLQKAVSDFRLHSDMASITGGFIKYLKSNDRKAQFLPGNKNRNYSLKPTPTKYVLSLMQFIDHLDKNGVKIWEPVLQCCRYILFNLDRNATPSLDVVDSVTHLFVNMCQFNGRKNAKLVIVFMLSAMYCANYRAIIIIKHCLDLVPEILPHEYDKEKTLHGMKPLLRTFIFLLHFYSCNDQFGKVEGVRFTLKKRYCYNPTQDNDTTILFMLKETVMKISENCLDTSMLEYSLLILAKRKGTKWCHTNIVQKILSPIMKGEIYASKAAFRFCITIVTKLLKPYNNDMTVHIIEVVNLLMKLIEQPHHQEVKEDIICSLMCLTMNCVTDRINTFLANWNPPSISPKLEKALEKYIEVKPLKYWRFVHQELLNN